MRSTYCEQIPFDGPYGTKSEKMACPLSALIEARFTDFAGEGKDYPDVSVLQKKFVSIRNATLATINQGFRRVSSHRRSM